MKDEGNRGGGKKGNSGVIVWSLCWSAFHYCNKTTEKINFKRVKVDWGVTERYSTCLACARLLVQSPSLKKKKLIWSYSFRGFIPCFWTCGKAVYHGESTWQRKLLTTCFPGGERDRGVGSRCSLPGHASSDLEPVTRYHPLKFPTPLNSAKLGSAGTKL